MNVLTIEEIRANLKGISWMLMVNGIHLECLFIEKVMGGRTVPTPEVRMPANAFQHLKFSLRSVGKQR